MYGLAEQASKIIRATYNGVGQQPGSGSNNGGDGQSGDDDNGVLPLASSGSFALAVVAVLVSSLLLL